MTKAKPLIAPTRLPREVEDQLRRAGLGARYLTRRLDDFGPVGTGLRDLLKSETASTELSMGYGTSIYGTGVHSHDLFMVLARAVYLKGFAVRIISLSVLIKELSGPDIDISIEAAPALFVHPFYDPAFAESPMTTFQRLAVEDLLTERMDNARSVFTLSRDKLVKAKAWWTPAFIDRLSANNQEIGVQ